MKKLILAALVTLSFYSCHDDKKQESQLFDQIMVVHNRLMTEDDKLMNDKMKLDSMAKMQLTGVADTTAEKAKIHGLVDNLKKADDQMNDWMHKFEPDQTNKPHDQVMKYFNEQKKQIDTIDQKITQAVKTAGDYLKQHPQK